MNYIEKINAARAIKGVSIRKLSLNCGLSELAIKKILNTTSIPSMSSIEKICAALEIPLADLFCTDNETVIKNDTQAIKILDTLDTLSQETQYHLLWIANKLKGL